MSSAIFTRAIAPATPPAGKVVIYAKVDGRLYWKDETGLESPLRPVGAGTGDLMADGTVPLTANWNVGAFDITAEQFHSSMADGTTPFTVVSTTVVPNLNADRLDGANLIDEDNMVSDSDVHVPTQQSVKAYVDSAVIGAITYMGAYDAAGNTPDLDTAPTGVSVGDMYTVTVAGTFFTAAVEVGDVLIAEIDSASVEADWTIVNRNIDSIAFATSAQGALADTAVQPGDDVETLGSGAAPDGQVPIADGLGGIAWAEPAAGGLTPVFVAFADSPYTATAGEIIFCDTSGGAIAITYPAGVDEDNIAVTGDATSGTNNITVTPNGAETIDDDISFVIDQNWGQINAAYDATNTNWIVALTGSPDLVNATEYANVKIIAGTTYTVLEEDAGFILVFTNAAAIAVTLPNTFALNFQFTAIQTTAAGVPTVTRSGADTINGASTGVAPSAQWKGAYFVQHTANAWICLK